jgi:hypothetical protein
MSIIRIELAILGASVFLAGCGSVDEAVFAAEGPASKPTARGAISGYIAD